MTFDDTILQKLRSSTDSEALDILKAFVNAEQGTKDFGHLDFFARKALSEFVVNQYNREERNGLIASEVLNAIRLIARDKNQLDVIFEDISVRKYIVFWAFEHPIPTEGPDTLPAGIVEGLVCLVNANFNSQLMKDHLSSADQKIVLNRYSELANFILQKAKLSYKHALLMLLRVLFLLTALCPVARVAWSNDAFRTPLLDDLVRFFGRLPCNLSEKDDGVLFIEYSKVLFNLYNKTNISIENENKLAKTLMIFATSECAKDTEVIQQICNMFVAIPGRHILLSADLHDSESLRKLTVFDGLDVTVFDRLIKLLEERVDNKDHDQIGVILTVLIRYCVSSAKVRRFCRLQVLPPLRGDDVSRRPDQGDTMRNKLVRVMMDVHHINQLASEFMFILCKRSVPRMIKYTGFGHSAGLLANSGLLGMINSKPSEENSEDSETEEYSAVEDMVNPVTGHIKEEGPNPFDGMTEAQKEYESMKLVEAMNKLLSAGVIQPGKIGEDGKVRPVSHILELTKNIPDQDEEDSD